jgi:MFS family permease
LKLSSVDSIDNPFNKKAIWLYIVAFLFYATNHMLIISLPFFSQTLGANQATIGMIMGAYMFVSMFLRPIAGAIVDKLGSRKLFMIALILNAIVLASYTIETLWAFAVMRALQGAILAFFSMTVHLLIIDLISEKTRGQGISMLSLASMVPYTFVPALILFFKDHLTMTHLLLLFFGVGACNVMLGSGLFRVISLKPGQESVSNKLKRIEEKPVRSANRAILYPSVIMLLASIVFCVSPTFLPLYLESKGLHTAPLYFLTETAVLIVIRFYGRKYIPSSSALPIRLIAPLIICFILAPGLLCLSLSTPVILLSAVLNGLALSLLYPSLMTYITFVVPERTRGYSIGWFIAAADLGTSSGAYLMGWLAGEFSYQTMLITAVFIGLGALLFTLLYPRARGGVV